MKPDAPDEQTVAAIVAWLREHGDARYELAEQHVTKSGTLYNFHRALACHHAADAIERGEPFRSERDG